MTNLQMAEQLIAQLFDFGVREVCLCTGARNAPFVQAIAQRSDLTTYSFFDERTAAFFALGRARATDHPVVVCTTSGTAVAELLPATIEARYVGAPLILLTADRPKRFRMTGAPQTIDQVTFLKSEVGQQWDIESWPQIISIDHYPAHINVCFEEPVLSASFGVSSVSPIAKAQFDFDKPCAPLVVVGALGKRIRSQVLGFLKKNAVLRILEAHSGLSGHPDLSSELELNGRWISASVFRQHFDSVIRIGGIPTTRLWRDLEYELQDVPVVNFSNEQWSGLGRDLTPAREMSDFDSLKLNIQYKSVFDGSQLATKWQTLCDQLSVQLPLSELAMVRQLSATLPHSARVMIGNSLPIREWDLVAVARPDVEVITQRGVNGIDGLLSTFLAMCGPGENVMVVGDLSAFYDANAFWILRTLPEDVKFKIVVLNNQGGRIFRRMFQLPELELEHNYDFQSFAKLWSLDYHRVEDAKSWPSVWTKTESRALIEVKPQLSQSDSAWNLLERFQLS